MTKQSDQQAAFLPEEILWAVGGHVSDVVLTAIGDGQAAIVPASAQAHVAGCTVCTNHLGNAALLSLHTGQELGRLTRNQLVGRSASATPGGAPRKIPRLAIFLGLVVAALGLVPSLLDTPSDMATAKTFATHELPMLANGLGTLARRLLEPGSVLGLVLTYGTAAVLVVMGVTVVRLSPKKEVPR